ncbi:hypothetical protein PanWU01x14_223660 [Parasponia andersonii]|uniref:Uncharacterized protein n=1 Tax=Parasponia andersonii TaxID=3476 RepID=A0A2P5BNS7_PARAD|nr:hypothetical protein PanWU01x14_223660 [Parasponia andersonii]
MPPKGGAIGTDGNLKCVVRLCLALMDVGSSFEVQETNVSGQLESLACSGFLRLCRGLGHPGCFNLAGRVRSEDFRRLFVEQLDLFCRIVDLEVFSGSFHVGDESKKCHRFLTRTDFVHNGIVKEFHLEDKDAGRPSNFFLYA